MGRKHSYKDYNITLWVSPKDDVWEFMSVVSGPMNGGAYTTVKIDGTKSMPSEEDAYECAYDAAIRHIDNS